MWYTKPEAVRRFTVWFCGLGLGQIFGGLTSWVTQNILSSDGQYLICHIIQQGFQHFTGESIAGWRVMFIVLGILTIVVGLFTITLMPDNQMTAKWLTDAEKSAAIQRVAVNQTGIQNMQFKWSHLKELVLDVQIWLLVVLIALVHLYIFTHLLTIFNRDHRFQSAPG